MTKNKINTCLWFDNKGEEAAKFYTSIFKNSKIKQITKYGDAGAKASGRPKGSVMTVTFELDGQAFMALNGGPIFKFTPAISLFVHCDTEKEVDTLYKKLSSQGSVLMPLQKYPFSEKYCWIADKYGLTWQINLAKGEQKIAPALLFVGKQHGKAEEAIKFYTSLFKNSKINTISRYEKGEQGAVGKVKYSSFTLDGQEFKAMESNLDHKFNFNEAVSFSVNCKDQKEIDYFWEKLTKGGSEQPCGWLKDKFGVSWQIVPAEIDKMMNDAKKTEKVMAALMPMKKIDLKKLQEASSR